MDVKGCDPGRLQEIIQGMKGMRVVVVGDVILDEYIWGNATRISREAPVPIVEVRRMRRRTW
jgi:D-beta-D-heptose 7-phosphate kinase/D-beta-D-heptose 1-phosphate adenosyltransferase